MIKTLSGIVHRQGPEHVTMDVHGVGYGVCVPLNVWDDLKEGKQAMLYIFTDVREDRFD